MCPCDFGYGGTPFPTLQTKEKMSFANVQEFNDTFGVKTRGENTVVRVREAKLRFKLIKEEFKELRDAFEDCDIVEVVDALGDILYVTFGAAQAFGITEAKLLTIIQGLDNYKDTLILENVQTEILALLRKAILINDAESVTTVLAVIVKSVYDAANIFGVDVDGAVEAIHTSNMTKLGEDGKPLYNEDLKVIKGPNYKTPTADIEKILGFDNVETAQ
ncbi:MazG-like nucleotide pyrophosphohydrolase [Arthrobacter phage Racecar]|nr:MazG-like nucleotide pyrophosphohydrolase [Arthrobacter phage Racecar]